MKECVGLIIIALMVFAPLSMAQAEKATVTLLLGKLEANLWESAAAVFFHIADHDRGDQRIALNDYQDDLQTISRVFARLKEMKLSEKGRAALVDLEKTWEIVKAKGDALIKIDLAKEKSTPVSDSKMHDYWLSVEKLDQKIDELIEAIAGVH